LDLSHEKVAQDMWRELKIHIYGSMRSAGRVSWIAILGQRGTRNLRWKVATQTIMIDAKGGIGTYQVATRLQYQKSAETWGKVNRRTGEGYVAIPLYKIGRI
jgi:hypothetical protein